MQNEVLAAQKAIAAGKLHPFSAKSDVLDNEGHVVIAKGQTLNDGQIVTMKWLAAGVQAKAGGNFGP